MNVFVYTDASTRRCNYGEADSGRPFVGDDRAVVAASEASSQAASWPQAGRAPQSVVSDPVRPQNGARLGTAAPGTGLGIGHDGVASTARLAKEGGVGQDPRSPVGPPATSRPDRLVA